MGVHNDSSWRWLKLRKHGRRLECGRRAFRTLQNSAILALCALLASCGGSLAPPPEPDDARIQPYRGNPFYWQYHGEPIFLIGASDYHNIFQRPDLIEHLDRMAEAGANYVRNTMASREIFPDHRDLWPYRVVRETEDPLIPVYDLDQWNEEYWGNFDRMLRETAARDMIVEIEIWERHDCYRTRDQAGWLRHPFNPDNNVNYTAEESGLPVGEFTRDPGHPFFATVPELDGNERVLSYQQAFVDKILSYTFEFQHVLYNMNNETKERAEWGQYWGRYILRRAEEAGRNVELTDMQDAHDVTDDSVRRVLESELYTFVDISQNNFQRGQLHWERILSIRAWLSHRPRPITNVKVYGRDDAPPPEGYWGDTRDGVERFWRNLMAGASSTRFHRPMWGLGLNETAQAHVRSMRMLTDSMRVFACEPRNDLLSDRLPNEAYCLAEDGRQYAVYFPDGGSVDLNVSEARGPLTIRWLDLEQSRWAEPTSANAEGSIRLEPPGRGHWAALVLARIPHTSPTAAPESGAFAALPLLALLDVLHEYDCAGLRRAPCIRTALRPLATETCEECGLAEG